MGKSIGMKIQDYLLGAQIMIDNAIGDAEILEEVSKYGYNQEKLQYGKNLYTLLVELHNNQKKEYGEQLEATEELNKIWEETDKLYMKALKVARVALQGNLKADNAMMIDGPRKQSLSGWLVQVEAFYRNLLKDDNMLVKMSEFGYDIKKIEVEYELFKKVSEKNLKQKKERGEAQEATEKRDNKLDELDKWLSDFRAIAKVALSDTAQKLEKLGIIARYEKRNVKKANEDMV